MKRMWVIFVAFSLFWYSSQGHAMGPGHDVASIAAKVKSPNETVDKIGFPYDPAVVIPEKPSTVNISDPTKPNENCKDTLTTGFYQFIGDYQNPYLRGNGKGKLGNYSLRFILFRKLRL